MKKGGGEVTMCKHKPSYNNYFHSIYIPWFGKRTLTCQYCQQELLLPSIKAYIGKVIGLLLFPTFPIVISFIAAYSDYMRWIKMIICIGIGLLFVMVSLLWYYYLCATNSFIVKSEQESSAEPESNENEQTD